MTQELPRIINDSCLKMELIEKASIDLIITSPPYNLGIKYRNYDDSLSHKDYLKFCAEWLKNCYIWLKNDGRICLNIPLDTHKKGSQSIGADITCLLKEIGFKFQATIVWHNGRIMTKKDISKRQHYADARVYAPVELILVFYKRLQEKQSGSRISDLSLDEYQEWIHGLWQFEPAWREVDGHPVPFPIELPHRCIKLFSYVGDTILDPFMGSGTTLLAADKLNRRSTGIEIDREYCKIAWNKIKQQHEMLSKNHFAER